MIDLHCDTVSKLASVFHRGDLMHNPYSVDVERLEKAGALIQCFSTFFDVGKYGTTRRDEKAYVTANHMIDVFEKNLRLCHDKVIFVKKKVWYFFTKNLSLFQAPQDIPVYRAN